MATSFDATAFLRSEPAVADLSAKDGYALIFSGAGVTVAGANARIVGICVDPVASGRNATYQVAGQVRAVAGAGVSKGALLTTDSSGRLVTATTGQNVVAQALEAGSANAVMAVEVFPGGGGLAP